MISILLPHKDRAALTFKTVCMYKHWLDATCMDYEIIVADDSSECMSELKSLAAIRGIRLHNVTRKHGGANSVIAFNEMAAIARGNTFIISNAESYPAHPGFVEKAVALQSGTYRVGSVWSLDPLATMKLLSLPAEHLKKPEDFMKGEWYQHSVHRNRCLHFFSIITAHDYHKIGGFPKSHEDAFGHDDVAFLEAIKAAGIQVVPDDDILVFHQNHYGGLYTNGFDGFRKWSL